MQQGIRVRLNANASVNICTYLPTYICIYMQLLFSHLFCVAQQIANGNALIFVSQYTMAPLANRVHFLLRGTIPANSNSHSFHSII